MTPDHRFGMLIAAVVAMGSRICAGDSETSTCRLGEPALGSGRMFDEVAPRYDLINRVMSLTMDQSWRLELVSSLELQDGDRVLDLATGTADVAILEAKDEKGVEVLGIDPSENMIELGRSKILNEGLENRISLQIGDAMALDTIQDASFDKVSIAFGIRNIPDRLQALKEIRRVVRDSPGSRVAVLEFTEPHGGIIEFFARLYIRHVVPLLGSILSGKWREYMHLESSIAEFPAPDEFKLIMEKAGLRVTDIRYMMFNSVILFTATPILHTQDASSKPRIGGGEEGELTILENSNIGFKGYNADELKLEF
ncbi:hypothetical protein AAMO2058_001087100 [Amorphochlora amoebiformis]